MTLKLFYIDNSISDLADTESRTLHKIKRYQSHMSFINQVSSPDEADALIIQEKTCFKDFKYISALLRDPVISKYPNKVYTINSDDCATGLLKGVYTSLPKKRLNTNIHRSIPYAEYPNELIHNQNYINNNPTYLASWRGNIKSNKIRTKLLKEFKANPRININTTDSWLNHSLEEKETYINIIINSKFSICPAGWAPVSFRIYESMALGRSPVILADDFTPPEGPIWTDFALFIPEHKIHRIEQILQQKEYLYKQLGDKSRHAWEQYFSPSSVIEYISSSLISLITNTPLYTKDIEVKRWKSLPSYWNNNWTLPQRALNRLRITIKKYY